jgi:hypothetical protein
MEDYSNFSWESIQKAWRDIVDKAQKETGATDEQMALAVSQVANNFMETNFLKSPACNYCQHPEDYPPGEVSRHTHTVIRPREDR